MTRTTAGTVGILKAGRVSPRPGKMTLHIRVGDLASYRKPRSQA